ncbi:hypothetical protein GCM10011339_11520 [Echinicola rosea]|uniref:Uncharacterized protein n=1 Tax=Echinicola rosea TaxID=1807691 RepID=A0ABQ1UST9_9BACT|nr:hypothetical protein GCM10011339_11520 [Echinicola rosea]
MKAAIRIPGPEKHSQTIIVVYKVDTVLDHRPTIYLFIDQLYLTNGRAGEKVGEEVNRE